MRFYEGTAAAMVLFGNIGLLIPYKGAKSGDFTVFLVAFSISVLLYFLCFKWLEKFKTKQINKALFYVAGIISVIFCLVVCAETSKHFLNYISTEVLIKNRKIYSVVAFLGIVIYALFRRPEAIVKFSAPALVFIALSVLILFLVSGNNFNADFLSSLFVPKTSKSVLRMFEYLLLCFVSPTVFAVFSAFYFKKPSLKTEIVGLGAGAVILAVCFLSGVLTFSLAEASEIRHAYPKSVSVISVGELFTRMEGIACFVFFFSALVKTVICAFSVKALLFSMKIARPKETAALLTAGAVLISAIL